MVNLFMLSLAVTSSMALPLGVLRRVTSSKSSPIDPVPMTYSVGLDISSAKCRTLQKDNTRSFSTICNLVEQFETARSSTPGERNVARSMTYIAQTLCMMMEHITRKTLDYYQGKKKGWSQKIGSLIYRAKGFT
eukprot:GEMP01073640.1.p1 GENE.GEMP01073640.1~~GEMP01073640.1.p1  ORF type:complete len:134 (+),score=8.25 GEMP01073640.1:364-765(+)